MCSSGSWRECERVTVSLDCINGPSKDKCNETVRPRQVVWRLQRGQEHKQILQGPPLKEVAKKNIV